MVQENSKDNPEHHLLSYQTETDEEKEQWIKAGAKEDDQGIWRIPTGQVVMPIGTRRELMQLYHGKVHAGAKAMKAQISETWWWPRMMRDIDDYCRRCLICMKANVGKSVKVRMSHAPRPTGPWTHLQIDFTGPLSPSGGYQYILVIMDRFTRWVEAFPTRTCTAEAAARVMVEEVFPRWGLPYEIDSDNGTHFTGKLMKEAMKLMGIKQKFHIPYHPESSGMVERMNRSLKTALTKAILQTGQGWHKLLPAILWNLRATPNRVTGLTPFELMTGRAMVLPPDAPPPAGTGGDSTLFQEKLRRYLTMLDKATKDNNKKVREAQQQWDEKHTTTDIPHIPELGSFVMVKRIARKGLEPRWEGPYEILLKTDTSVCLKGKGVGTDR
ncbi:hypothetical protein PO909_015233 [Leuciscus waleckii]